MENVTKETKKLKPILSQKESDELKKERQVPETKSNLERIEEKIDKLGMNMSSSKDYYFNSADTPLKNLSNIIKKFKKLKKTISWKDDWIPPELLRDLNDNIQFDDLEITKIRILQKVFSNDDYGKSFFLQSKALLNIIKYFNSEHENCEIEYRVFFTEIAEVVSKDKFHKRYLFDNDRVYEVPGGSQFTKMPKHDSTHRCDEETSIIIRKDFEEIWKKAEKDVLSDKFIEKFVTYVIKKEKEVDKIIEEAYPDIVLKIKKDFEDKKKGKENKIPDYIKDESTILQNVEQIIFKRPEIIDNLKQNPEEIDQALYKIMAETKGKKLDPEIVKKILKEKAKQ